MKHTDRKIAALALITAVYFLLFQAVRYDLRTAAVTQGQTPVTVILDAGHGGEDGGASAASGLLESQLNLEITLRLEQLIALLGYEPYLIRREDVSVYTGNCETLSEKKVSDLKNRVATVNGFPAAVLVSIHQNHFSQEQYRGPQVFYGQAPAGKTLAGDVRAALLSLDAVNKRPVKAAQSVYLMQNAACPAILVECGFLSNAAEALRLETADYQKQLTCAIAAGVTAYLQKGEDPHEV